MVNLLKVIAILLLVLPALISASCQLSVESHLQDTQSNYNVYRATINNVGDASASDVQLSTTSELRKVSGLKACDDGFSLPRDTVKSGGIAAGESYTFTYKAKKGTNVVFTATCESDDATVTEPSTAPTSRPKHTTTTTTRAPKKQTTTTTTTTAPKKQTTTTTTTKKASTTTTTTKKGTTTTTTTPAPVTSTTTTKKGTTTTTQAPSANGKKCSGNTWWAPSPLTTWQWQLTGTIDTSVNVQMYDIDLFDNTAATISTLHSQGRVVICYFSTQYENWRPDASDFTSAVLGNNLDDWAGEKYVDIRSTVVRNIMTARMALAASKGCDGVEPDNVDGYEASTGFPLTAADQLNFNEFIASAAHAAGLSVGLKNDVDQAKSLEPYFDWALNEQCNEYDECDSLDSFITAGKAVFNCEYSGSATSVCPKMNTAKFSTIFKTLDLTAKINTQCCSTASGGCSAQAAAACVSSTKARSARSVEMLEGNATQEQLAEVHASSATTTYVSAAAVFAVAVAALAL